VIGVLALTLAYPLRLYLRQQEEIADLTAGNAERQRRVDELRNAVALYGDPNWVGDEARRRLHYVRPGEQAYLQPAPEPPSPPPTAAPERADPDTAWYGQLWSQMSGSSGSSSVSSPTPVPSQAPAP
jgi:hypothetical protein